MTHLLKITQLSWGGGLNQWAYHKYYNESKINKFLAVDMLKDIQGVKIAVDIVLWM